MLRTHSDTKTTPPQICARGGDADRNPRSHAARYLLLFGNEAAPRAALLDEEKRVMVEMIGDDGYAVDNLIRHGVPCAPPAPATLKSIDPKVAGESNLRCFELD